jgi:hypothetical protein
LAKERLCAPEPFDLILLCNESIKAVALGNLDQFGKRFGRSHNIKMLQGDLQTFRRRALGSHERANDAM